MVQKIVMKVKMRCSKCRKNALQIASTANGVNYVAVDGDEEKLVVKGDGIDAVTLVSALRKKVGYTDIICLRDDDDY